MFLWIYQKLKAFVSHYRLFSGLSFRSRSHPPLHNPPDPSPRPYRAHMTHMTVRAGAQHSTCPCRGFAWETVCWDTARFSPSALLRNHSESLESVAILDDTARTVCLSQISQRDTETAQGLASVKVHNLFFMYLFILNKGKGSYYCCYLIHYYVPYDQAACVALCLRRDNLAVTLWPHGWFIPVCFLPIFLCLLNRPV